MNNKLPELLTVKEVSKLLRIHIRTVQRLSKQGKIKAVKIGDQWRYKRSDIEKYREIGTDFFTTPIRKTGKPFDRSDRRSYPRINTSLNCTYSISLYPFKNINDYGIIRNLSGNGVFISIPINKTEILNIDGPVNLLFSIILDNIDIKARIIRKTKNGIGLKFRNIPEQTRNRITKYIG